MRRTEWKDYVLGRVASATRQGLIQTVELGGRAPAYSLDRNTRAYFISDKQELAAAALARHGARSFDSLDAIRAAILDVPA